MGSQAHRGALSVGLSSLWPQRWQHAGPSAEVNHALIVAKRLPAQSQRRCGRSRCRSGGISSRPV